MRENTLEQSSNWEGRKAEIEHEIEMLRQDCLTEEEFDLIRSYLEIPESLTAEIELDLKKRLDSSTLFLRTLPELAYALEAVKFPKETKEDILAHENAHGNKADEVGAKHDGYKLVFIKDKNGKLIFAPAAQITIPKNDVWAKERQAKTRIEITQAPEMHGNKLSEQDKEDLRRLGD